MYQNKNNSFGYIASLFSSLFFFLIQLKNNDDDIKYFFINKISMFQHDSPLTAVIREN